MKEQRHSKNRSRNRDNNRRDQDRRGGGRGKDGGRRGPHSYNGRGRSDYHSGNQRERISIESGHLVLIDQFMLANLDFTNKLNKLIDDDPGKKNSLIEEFGGRVVELPPGLYRIDRNPYNMTIVIHPDGVDTQTLNAVNKSDGVVYVDTRCLAMIDRELLDDPALIEKYHFLWHSDQSKACRDLLRDNGGAVRYGFSKEKDELEVAFTDNKLSLVISPVGGASNASEVDASEVV